MTPLANAVGFIDCNSRELALRVYGCQVLAEKGGESILRSNVEEPDKRMSYDRSEFDLL